MKRFGKTIAGLAGIGFAALLLPAHALEPAELFEKVSPSVWGVQTEDSQGRKLASGSAVVIGPGRLVTNCHVLAKAKSFVVRKDNISYGASLEFPDPERDLCQIKVANFTAPAVDIARIDQLKVGSKVYAIGNPRGFESTLSDGLLSGLRRSESGTLEMIQTTAPISPGSSGGGLFDSEGRLIGITTMVHRDAQNLNFAMPAEWIGDLSERGRRAMERRVNGATASSARPAIPLPGAGGDVPPLAIGASLRIGDSFGYALTDRMNNRSQQINYRVDRIDGDKAVFNDGARTERVNGELLEIVAPIAVELDAVTPPGGWMRNGKVLPSGASLQFSRILGDRFYKYELSAVAAAEAPLSLRAGQVNAVRIDVRGWSTRAHRTAMNQLVSAPYTATVWYSPELQRVAKISVLMRVSSNIGSHVDETLELVEFTRR